MFGIVAHQLEILVLLVLAFISYKGYQYDRQELESEAESEVGELEAGGRKEVGVEDQGESSGEVKEGENREMGDEADGQSEKLKQLIREEPEGMAEEHQVVGQVEVKPVEPSQSVVQVDNLQKPVNSNQLQAQPQNIQIPCPAQQPNQSIQQPSKQTQQQPQTQPNQAANTACKNPAQKRKRISRVSLKSRKNQQTRKGHKTLSSKVQTKQRMSQQKNQQATDFKQGGPSAVIEMTD